MSLSIIEACKDERLFRPYFGKDWDTYASWRWILRAIYGLPIRSEAGREFIRQATGRDPDRLNPKGYKVSCLLTGRRSGKSRTAAIIASFEASLAGGHNRLAKGEQGLVCCISPTQDQSSIVHKYVRSVYDSPALSQEIVRDTKDGFELRGGVRIGILTGDWRHVRGFSTLACVVDEICFMGHDSDSKVKNDTELINALMPSLATTGGRLVAISSPYAKKGWAYRQWKNHWANNDSDNVLCVNGASKLFNPSLDQAYIDAALVDDYASARAEYFGEWRDDVGLFIPREVVEALVMKGTTELLPRRDEKYHAFVDVSGGRGDDAALAIAHREDGKVVVDFIGRWKAPFDPERVIGEMVVEMKRYKTHRCVGDNYSAEFTASAFGRRGIKYTKSEKNKSELYLELLPKLCSGQIELLDHEPTINQLCALERKTRSGGRDTVDHPAGGFDDLANVIAGVAQAVITPRIRVGSFPLEDESRSIAFNY